MPMLAWLRPHDRGWDEGSLHVLVALAKVPKPDLVEIVQAQGAGDGVHQSQVGHRLGNDIGQVQLEEVDVAENVAAIGVSYFDLRARVRQRCGEPDGVFSPGGLTRMRKTTASM